jgi:gluconokinase
MKIVIGGVSGSGKSTVGQYLANMVDADFLDADDYHPPANIQKMSEGIPLNDQDRAGWIEALGKELARRPKVVLACSALKKIYRDRLKQWEPATQFAILILDRKLLEGRIAGRAHTGHFMPATLLDSQLATLETGCDVVQIINVKPPEEIAQQIVSAFNL